MCQQLEGQQRFQGCTRYSKLLTRIYRRWGFSRNGQGSTCNRRWTVQHHMQTHQARRGVWQYTLILSPIFFFRLSVMEKTFFLFGSTIFFESKEITLTAHEVAAGMVMGRSLGTNAMHLGTYVLSQDPRKKRTKIMSPWVSVISFSPLLTPLTSLCILSFWKYAPMCISEHFLPYIFLLQIQMMIGPMNSNIVKNAFEFRDSNYEMVKPHFSFSWKLCVVCLVT